MNKVQEKKKDLKSNANNVDLLPTLGMFDIGERSNDILNP